MENIEIGSEERDNKRAIQKHRIISDEELSNVLVGLPQKNSNDGAIGTDEGSKNFCLLIF